MVGEEYDRAIQGLIDLRSTITSKAALNKIEKSLFKLREKKSDCIDTADLYVGMIMKNINFLHLSLGIVLTSDNKLILFFRNGPDTIREEIKSEAWPCIIH